MAKKLGLIENLSGGLKKSLHSNIGASEEILVSLQGHRGEALVATDKAVYVLKAGFSSGALFGGKCKAFPYRQITSVEFSCALLQGRIQITAGGTAEHAHGTQIEAWQAENVVNFPSQKKIVFQEAANLIRKRVDAAHSRPSPATSQIIDESEQLRKLAVLLGDGIITQEEFEAKKRQILGI